MKIDKKEEKKKKEVKEQEKQVLYNVQFVNLEYLTDKKGTFVKIIYSLMLY